MGQEPELLLIGGAASALAAIVGLLVWRALRSRAKRPAPDKAVASGAARSDLIAGLSKTRSGFLSRLRSAWGAGGDADARLLDLEEVLLSADVGVKATQALVARLRKTVSDRTDLDALRDVLRQEMLAILEAPVAGAEEGRPHVILVAGVNGVGKTTTIAKLAKRYQTAGKKVLLVAADTFRAAAAEQLAHWAERIGVECVRHQANADPAAVVFDGIAAGVARKADVVIIDTAGRLHVKQHLVEELKKLVRIAGRQLEGAPHEVLLVIDATTGQNALAQARVFQEALSLTGIVLTKLDGTAKGGVVFALRKELDVPVRYVGLGEGIDDLDVFDAPRFVDALLVDAPAAPDARKA